MRWEAVSRFRHCPPRWQVHPKVAQGTQQDHPTGMHSICLGEADDRQPSCTALGILPAPSLTQLLRSLGLVQPLE